MLYEGVKVNILRGFEKLPSWHSSMDTYIGTTQIVEYHSTLLGLVTLRNCVYKFPEEATEVFVEEETIEDPILAAKAVTTRFIENLKVREDIKEIDIIDMIESRKLPYSLGCVIESVSQETNDRDELIWNLNHARKCLDRYIKKLESEIL